MDKTTFDDALDNLEAAKDLMLAQAIIIEGRDWQETKLNPELYEMIVPSKRKFFYKINPIYFIHPQHGSCSLMVEQDGTGSCVSKLFPPTIELVFCYLDWKSDQGLRQSGLYVILG